MPKLNAMHISRRLDERIEQLEAGEEVAIKEIKSLLTSAQQQALDNAWRAQIELREQKRARNKEEEKALGWKTKREVRIEILKQARDESEENMLASLQDLQAKGEVRRARIFMQNFALATQEGKTFEQAISAATNALTRAHIQPYATLRSPTFLSKRDREIREMEDALRKSLAEEDERDAIQSSAKTGKKRQNSGQKRKK